MPDEPSKEPVALNYETPAEESIEVDDPERRLAAERKVARVETVIYGFVMVVMWLLALVSGLSGTRESLLLILLAGVSTMLFIRRLRSINQLRL